MARTMAQSARIEREAARRPMMTVLGRRGDQGFSDGDVFQEVSFPCSGFSRDAVERVPTGKGALRKMPMVQRAALRKMRPSVTRRMGTKETRARSKFPMTMTQSNAR